MKVKIKKLVTGAIIPSYSKDGDAGLDLTAISYRHDEDTEWTHEYGTGLSIEIPKGFVGLLFPRSSIYKYDLVLSNHVGVIDSGYRGEIKLKFKRLFDISVEENKLYKIGDRIAQLIIVPYPNIEFIESTELSDSERGDLGFGSTDLQIR